MDFGIGTRRLPRSTLSPHHAGEASRGEERRPPKTTPLVQVVSSTWTRDSHDLFDFEAHHLHTRTFSVPGSMRCVRSGTEVHMLSGHCSGPPGADQLLRLVQKDGFFWVDRASHSSSSRKLWLVVRDLATSGHTLAQGDVIKLGRFKFRVRQMVSSITSPVRPELKLDGGAEVSYVDVVRLGSAVCRICLSDNFSEEDPLIAPCKCKGSIEHVHLSCLRHWIKDRLDLADTENGSYFYKPLTCELCRSCYGTSVQIGGERVPLAEVPRTAPPFIVLEHVVRDSESGANRGLHVLSLAESKVLTLGRGHESDVRIQDVSISRCHATIRFQRGEFVLEDHNSKFGTVVALQKPRLLQATGALSIQVGRTVLSLALRPNPGICDDGNIDADEERALRPPLLARGGRECGDVVGARTAAALARR